MSEKIQGRNRETQRHLTLGAILGPTVFTVAWLVLGVVSPGYTAWGAYIPYSPIHQGVSGLGMGPTAPFMNAAFIVNGLLGLVGVVGIFRAVPGMRTRTRWICAALLALPQVGSIVDGIFTLESFMLHNLGFALALTPALTFPVVGALVSRVSGWRGIGRWLIVAGPLTLALAIGFFATFTPTIEGSQVGVAGLVERVLILEMQATLGALAVAALRTPPSARSEPAAIVA